MVKEAKEMDHQQISVKYFSFLIVVHKAMYSSGCHITFESLELLTNREDLCLNRNEMKTV
jgi:hypothetical protein